MGRKWGKNVSRCVLTQGQQQPDFRILRQSQLLNLEKTPHNSTHSAMARFTSRSELQQAPTSTSDHHHSVMYTHNTRHHRLEVPGLKTSRCMLFSKCSTMMKNSMSMLLIFNKSIATLGYATQTKPHAPRALPTLSWKPLSVSVSAYHGRKPNRSVLQAVEDYFQPE